MGHFVYLVNLDVASNDTSREALESVRHVSLEGARDVFPLPWICCFRAEDLARYELESKDGLAQELQVPVTSVEKALENLTASLPRFERLTRDAGLARESWQRAVEAIKGLPHKFITLNIADFVFLDSRNAARFVAALSRGTDPLSGSDGLFEYKNDERSEHNSRVLSCPAYSAESDPAMVFVRLFERQMENAQKGIPGGIFLAHLYSAGGLGVKKDAAKAAHWQSVLERAKSS